MQLVSGLKLLTPVIGPWLGDCQEARLGRSEGQQCQSSDSRNGGSEHVLELQVMDGNDAERSSVRM